MDTRYFYHCFPRRSGADHNAHGLAILDSIVNRGLLLTHERVELRETLADGSLGKQSLILQKRICFTELAASELPEHCERFGRFALEWDVPTLVQMGAVPVFYVPLRATPDSLDGAAASMLARLGEVQELLSRLDSLAGFTRQPLDPEEKLSVTLNGKPAGQTACTVAGARDLIQYLQFETQPISVLLASVRYLLGYFYPTENLSYTEPLTYYRQREWRILANLVNRGDPVTHELSLEDANAITELDPTFFGRELDFPTGRQSLASACHLYPTFRGRHILESTRRILVPDDAVSTAQKILSDAGLKVDVAALV